MSAIGHTPSGAVLGYFSEWVGEQGMSWQASNMQADVRYSEAPQEGRRWLSCQVEKCRPRDTWFSFTSGKDRISEVLCVSSDLARE